MTDLSQKIKSLIEHIAMLEAAKKHYDILQSSIRDKEAELTELRWQLNKELDDIESLEKLSVGSLVEKLLGHHRQNLDKERQEYFKVSLKIKEVEKNIELTRFESSILENKIPQLEQSKALLETLKEKRQEEILLTNGENSDALAKILSEIDEKLKLETKLKEAMEAGNQLLTNLDHTLQMLQQAIDFGKQDTFNSSMIAGMKKFEFISNASRSCYAAGKAIRIFEKELQDAGLSADLPALPLQAFTRFSDEWIDNFISDWITLNKLKALASEIIIIRNKVADAMNEIKSKMAQERERLLEKEVLKDQWLLSAD